MKKLIFVFVLIAVISVGTAFADHPKGTGIGIQWRYPGGLDFTLKLPSIPIFWALGLGFDEDYFAFRVTGDYYLFHNVLLKEAYLHWFLGLGAWVGIASNDDDFYLSLGGRIPIGLSFQPIDLLEIHLAVAPSLGIQVTPNPKFPIGGFPVELGVRIWL